MPAARSSSTPAFSPGLVVRGLHGPLRLADFRLIAFDMDATLIDMECVDEIAAVAGRRSEVAAITAAAMRGDISDYRDSLRRRVALLAGVPEQALTDLVAQRLRFNPGVEPVVAAARAAGLRTLLVSGGFSHIAERVRERLGLDEAHSNVLEVAGGRLTGRLLAQPWGEIVDGEEKRRTLEDACRRLGIPTRLAIAVGDGANDLPMMRVAGLSVAYHAQPVVRAAAAVSIESGGMERLLEVLQP